jgi:DNA-binding NarL/FixJ family response regulator
VVRLHAPSRPAAAGRRLLVGRTPHYADPAAGSAERATDREVVVVAAILAAGSEKAAAHRLCLSHSTVKHHLANARSKVGAATTAQLVWILAPRLPEPEDVAQTDE